LNQHGKGGARFSNPSGGTDSVVATDTRVSRLEIMTQMLFVDAKKNIENLQLAVANLEEKVKTLEMTVKDIRWGQKEAGEDSLIEEERT